MRRHSCFAWLLFLALAVGAQAQTFTIKLKSDPDAGKSVSIRESDKETGTVKIVDAKGKTVRDDKVNIVKDFAYTETILEKGDKRPKKYQRVYEKAAETENGKTVPASYQDRTVQFELKDSKYQVIVEGKPAPSKSDLEALIEGANDSSDSDLDRAITPTKAVKVGDSWVIDNKLLAEVFGKDGELDLTKCKGEAKLAKVYQKDGKQFGVIEISMKLLFKSAKGVMFDPPALLDAKGTVDTAIDGSTTARTEVMTGKMTAKGQLVQEGMKFMVELNMEMAGRKERSVER